MFRPFSMSDIGRYVDFINNSFPKCLHSETIIVCEKLNCLVFIYVLFIVY